MWYTTWWVKIECFKPHLEDIKMSKETVPVVISNGDFHITNTSQRFENNPFIEYMELRTKNKIIMGRTDAVTSNQSTGEVLGHQMVATFRKVDAEQFVKIFADKVSHIFDLTKTGYRILMIVIALIQEKSINKDLFYMAYADAEKVARLKKKTLSRDTFKKGVAEIITHGIIARAFTVNTYFVNPAIIYNGNRSKLTFVEQDEMTDPENNNLENMHEQSEIKQPTKVPDPINDQQQLFNEDK